MSHEAIRLGDPNDFVEIEVLERGTRDGQNKGDLRLGVSVRSGTFAGSHDQVWIAKDEWKSFLGSMRRLERDRSGQASLVSMSPEEFELNLQVVDRAGHLAAHGCLSRYHFGHPSGKATRSRIEYHTPVDPSLLRELVLSLEALGQPAV
jgi:hypothetical protein